MESAKTIALFFMVKAHGFSQKYRLRQWQLALHQLSENENYSDLFVFHIYGDQERPRNHSEITRISMFVSACEMKLFVSNEEITRISMFVTHVKWSSSLAMKRLQELACLSTHVKWSSSLAMKRLQELACLSTHVKWSSSLAMKRLQELACLSTHVKWSSSLAMKRLQELACLSTHVKWSSSLAMKRLQELACLSTHVKWSSSLAMKRLQELACLSTHVKWSSSLAMKRLQELACLSTHIANVEMERGNLKSVKLFVIGVFMMSVYMARVLHMFTIKSKILIIIAAIASPLLATIVSFALMLWLKISITSTAGLIPLLMIGIGVDDAFLLIHAWQNYLPISDKRKRMAKVIITVGPSISITSVTNIIAFGVGSITASPMYAPAIFIVNNPPNISNATQYNEFMELVKKLEKLPTSYGSERTFLWLRDYVKYLKKKRKKAGYRNINFTYQYVPKFLASRFLADKNILHYHIVNSYTSLVPLTENFPQLYVVMLPPSSSSPSSSPSSSSSSSSSIIIINHNLGFRSENFGKALATCYKFGVNAAHGIMRQEDFRGDTAFHIILLYDEQYDDINATAYLI
uniref:SSD domain-containing protein n=1 Tax=Loa loa TaxID=7209 RepID=A0A1I7VF69_LOALO